MKRRLQSLQRIVAVKAELRRSTEWKLAQIAGEEQAALSDQAAILSALNSDQPLHGLFVGTMARHLRVVLQRLDTIRRAKAIELARLNSETAQLKHSERLLVDVTRQVGRIAEEKELSEIVEAALARSAASLP